MVAMSSMRDGNVVRTLTIGYKSEGADRATRDAEGLAAAQERLTKATEQVGVATETSARRQLSAAAGYDRLRSQTDEVYRAQTQLERGTRSLDRAVAQGIATEADAIRVRAQLQERYERQSGATAARERVEREEQRRAAEVQRARIEAVNQAQMGATKQYQEQARSQEDVQRRATALRSAIDPLHASLTRQNHAVEDANDLLKRGAITQTEHASAVAKARDAHDKFALSLKETGDSTKLAAYQVQNLRSQFIDIGTTLYGGMNPLTILAQQGPQIMQVFGPGAGVRGILRGVVTEAQSLVPLSLGIAGGIAGGLGVVAKAYLGFDASAKAVSVGLTGLGRQSGIAAGELEQIGRASTLATDSATRYATAFASTGNATRDTITTALSRTRDFATTFGTNFDDAAKIQQEFFADGASAYEKYAARLGTYNATTSRFLQDLQRNGRGGEAVRVALDEINPRLAKYNELASYGQRATNFLSDAWSNGWSNVNRGAAVVMGDPRLNVTPQQIADATAQGESARARAQQERAEAVRIDISRANQALRVNPVEREVLSNQERAGVRSRDKYETIQDRFSGVFGTAANPDLGSYKNELRERPSTPYFNGQTLKDVAERAEKSMLSTQDQLRDGIRRETQTSNDIVQSRALDDVLKQTTRTQQAQAAAMGKAAGEAERLTSRAGLLNRATADGIPLSEANRRRIDEVSDAFGRQTQKMAEASLQREILFQREQLTRSPNDAAIAATVRQVYGDDLNSKGAVAAAEQMRLTASIRDTQAAMSSLGQMGNTLIDPLVDSTRSWSSAFTGLTQNITRAVFQAALFGQGPFAQILGYGGVGAGPGGIFGAALGSGFGGTGAGILSAFGFGGGGYGPSSYAKAAAAAAPGAYGPGFSGGGYTGAGGRLEVAGYVHKGEVVFSQADVIRHGGVGRVEGMRLGRGYADGGIVGDSPAEAARRAYGSKSYGNTVAAPVMVPVAAPAAVQPAPPTVINMINAPGNPQVRESSDSRGGRKIDVVWDEMAAASDMRRNPKPYTR